ncbi:MAG: hypothetical protein ACRDNF_12610 [Streptosporangiaceae bacterium]
MSEAGASVLTVMTMQEAVDLAGCTVLCGGDEVVIVRRFSDIWVEVASPSLRQVQESRARATWSRCPRGRPGRGST